MICFQGNSVGNVHHSCLKMSQCVDFDSKLKEVKWLNTWCEEELHSLLRWLVTAECLGGWVGGDAVISAAMPLQPSPIWHPALSHPWWHPMSCFKHRPPPCFPTPPVFSPSWAWWSLHPLPDLSEQSSSSESKEEKLYIYIYIIKIII